MTQTGIVLAPLQTWAQCWLGSDQPAALFKTGEKRSDQREVIVERRALLLAAAGAVAGMRVTPSARAETAGVTATEIKIGNIMPYSGPASSYGAIGHGLAAYWKMINDQGGINGCKVNFISVDDGYIPTKTVEAARRLVEQDGVAFLLSTLGTAQNTAIQRYLNQKRVPQLFVSTGADKWGNYKDFPWTIGWQPSYRTEAQIYAKHILDNIKSPKIAILYQNDDFGRDYVIGLKDLLGPRYDQMVVKAISYEVTDPTIDSQVVTLQGSGANVLLTAATPKAAAQTIRKVFDLGWKPTHFLTNVSISVGAVITPAGHERAVGIITAGYRKDWTDTRWSNDPGMLEWLTFMKHYLPDADLSNSSYSQAHGIGVTAAQVLRQCGADLSRENIMAQAANLKDFTVPTLLPGIMINTSATNYHPIRQMQLMRWTGTSWDLFGDILEGVAV